MVAQFAVHSFGQFRVDEFLPFLDGQFLLVFGQDAEGVLGLVLRECCLYVLAGIFIVLDGDDVDDMGRMLPVYLAQSVFQMCCRLWMCPQVI